MAVITGAAACIWTPTVLRHLLSQHPRQLTCIPLTTSSQLMLILGFRHQFGYASSSRPPPKIIATPAGGAAGVIFDSKVLPTLLPFHTAWNTSVLPVTCKTLVAAGSTRTVVSHRVHGRKATPTKTNQGCEDPLMPCSGGQMALRRIRCSSSLQAGPLFRNSQLRLHYLLSIRCLDGHPTHSTIFLCASFHSYFLGLLDRTFLQFDCFTNTELSDDLSLCVIRAAQGC